MTCLEVRDRLVERSLGALPLEDVRDVERHMAWCAGCRKEAAQLDRAAATFALTLAPESPPAGLEDRVVTAVMAVADAPRVRPASRRGRSAAASVIAAAVAVSALGWGTAMAGRAERARESAKRARPSIPRTACTWERSPPPPGAPAAAPRSPSCRPPSPTSSW